MNNETAFALLGALIAVALILLVLVIFIGTVTSKAIGYFGRFRGFQAGRNSKDEMSFSGVIDETPQPEPGSLIIREQEQSPAPEVMN